MRKVKQIVKQKRKSAAKNCSLPPNLNIISPACQRSSVVEQRFRKPPVVGSTPTAGSIPLEQTSNASVKDT